MFEQLTRGRKLDIGKRKSKVRQILQPTDHRQLGTVTVRSSAAEFCVVARPPMPRS